MLYPWQTQTRTVEDLSGLWKFKMEDGVVNVNKPLTDYLQVAVPGSFNEQVNDERIRNHIGYFWYETEFNISKKQLKKRNVLRFGAVAQNCEVYINGQLVGKHIGGYTPFEFEISKYLKLGENDLKVHDNNLLDNSTVPTAKQTRSGDKIVQKNRFDFFNFAGINRPVKLYTTNDTYIDSIAVNYQVRYPQTIVTPDVVINGNYDSAKFTILDENDEAVSEKIIKRDEDIKLDIENTHLWQPRNAYLYKLKIDVFEEGKLVDSYSQTFGVRTIEVRDHQILINGKAVYLKGFGWHEDTIAHGGGVNPAQVVMDMNIMKSLGANSFRTSHYPYADETMQLADKMGFLVIDEAPAVGLFADFTTMGPDAKNIENTWDVLDTEENHKQALKEMIERDHDHPSVIIWSLANEPASMEKGAHKYFKKIADYAKKLDPQKRPMTIVNIMTANAENDRVDDLIDVLCLNRYWGWYMDFDDLEKAKLDLSQDLEGWHKKFPDKPVVFTEFGAETIAGMHSLTREPYSEEYQVDYYKANFSVFDKYDFVQGEQLWNFADFVTDPSLIRIGSENRKGVFTRDRKPKEIINYLRKRWQNK